MTAPDHLPVRRVAADGQPPVDALGEQFADVLARASAGDSAAFGQLWRSAHPSLLRYLFVVCGGDAEDVASETWLKVLRRLGSFSGDERGFRAWLAAVARNTAIDKGRQAARHPERLDGVTPDRAPDHSPDPADLALEAMGTRSALELVATSLPPAVAEMVILRVVLGLDVAQVAELVGRSSGAVRVAVHRGLRTLAGALPPALEPSSGSDVTTNPDPAFTVQ